MLANELHNKLFKIQCKHGAFGKLLAKKLSVGSYCGDLLKKNVQIAYSIDVLRRYQPFEKEITNAFKVYFERVNNNDFINIDIFVNSTLLVTYTGNISLDYLLIYLSNSINNTTDIHNYQAEVLNNQLYIFSSYEHASFNDTVYIVYNDGQFNQSIIIKQTSLKNNLKELLNAQNCITYKQFCNLYNNLLSEYSINEPNNID